jgi:hypothetical protein
MRFAASAHHHISSFKTDCKRIFGAGGQNRQWM